MKHPGTLILEGLSVLLSALPDRWVSVFAEGLGALWWHVLRYRRGVILENLARAFPDATPEARRRLGRRATAHLMRFVFEFFRIPRFRRLGFPGIEVEGLEHLLEARKAGKGVLCLSGHLGSFELAVAAFAPMIGGISLVVKAFPPAIDAFLTRIRGENGVGLIPARGAARGVLRALGRGETVVFVLDQNATRSTGVFVDFFGSPASTYAALASLAARRDVPVVPTLPYRRPDGGHVLEFSPPIPLEKQATEAETVRHMTQVYTRFIEDAIRAHPEQWFWTHKRWRTQPKSELPAEAASTRANEAPDA